MPRYVQKNRKRRKKRRGGPVYFLLSLALIAAAVTLAVGVFFKVTHIEVEGSTIYAPASIVAASGLKEGDNLFFLRKTAAIRAIFAEFPYVENVRVRRRLPGTIVIEITERVSVGMVPHGGVFWMIDGSGKLLEKTTVHTAVPKPVVKGITLLSPALGESMALPQNERERLRPVLALLLALHWRSLSPRVSEVDVSRMDQITLEYEDRLHVILGTADDIDIKLAFMEESIKKLPTGARGSLDLARAGDKIASYLPASAPPSPPEDPGETDAASGEAAGADGTGTPFAEDAERPADGGEADDARGETDAAAA
ncbi:MAG: FtsQ-type POTRA domain-containing protein [Oscillospiraceae bacterium]|jgi:cell division protein FtsQ|nr:FtsQ-type POTRA domain-containing protein [Oscillospiraceae bacterium]